VTPCITHSRWWGNALARRSWPASFKRVRHSASPLSPARGSCGLDVFGWPDAQPGPRFDLVKPKTYATPAKFPHVWKQPNRYRHAKCYLLDMQLN
jgi:hypothetical protein